MHFFHRIKGSIANGLTAHSLGYKSSQLSFTPDGITETATGRQICPFIKAPIELEAQGDSTLIRIFAPNSDTVVATALGAKGIAV